MAITRAKKEEVVAKIQNLVDTSKLTVFANYSGISVKEMQTLRAASKEQGVTVTVAKNRLVKLAFANHEKFKDADTALLNGQLAIAVSDSDEVAPARALATFAKEHPKLELVGAYDSEARLLAGSEVQALADLPSKDALRAQLVGTIAAPMTGFVTVMNGNLRGLVQVLAGRKDTIQA